MEIKRKISVKRMLNKMHCNIAEHSMWELALIKLMEERNHKLYNCKGKSYKSYINAFATSEILNIKENNIDIAEIELSEKSLMQIMKHTEKSFSTKSYTSLLNLNIIKDDEELLEIYLNNPELLKAIGKVKITLKDVEESKTMIDGIASNKEENKPLLFRTPSTKEFLFLIIDKQFKENFKNLRELNESIFETFINQLYEKRAYLSSEDILGKIEYEKFLNKFEQKINNIVLEDLQNNNYDFPIKISNAFAKAEKNHIYQLGEYIDLFNNVFEEIRKKPINEQNAFKDLLKCTPELLRLFITTQKIYEKELLSDIHISIKKETTLTIDLSALNNKLFKDLDDDSIEMSSDNFSISLDDYNKQNLIVKYSLNLNNLSEKDIMSHVVYLLVNPTNNLDLDTYFKELNLKVILKDKEVITKKRAKI